MSGKLFLQIVILMLIFTILTSAAKCLKKTYCPMFKSSTCEMCTKTAK